MLGEKQKKLMRKNWKKPFFQRKCLQTYTSKEERTWEDDTMVYCRSNLHQKRILTVRRVKKQ